jgi:hypothetical protein
MQRAPAPKPEALKMAAPKAVEPVEPPAAVALTGDLRQDLHDALRRAKLDFSADAIQHASVEEKGSDLIIRASKMRLMSLKDPKLTEVASTLLGKAIRIRTEVDETAVAAVPVQAAKETAGGEVRERALAHPGVKRFQELFPDSQVRTVRNLNE